MLFNKEPIWYHLLLNTVGDLNNFTKKVITGSGPGYRNLVTELETHNASGDQTS